MSSTVDVSESRPLVPGIGNPSNTFIRPANVNLECRTLLQGAIDDFSAELSLDVDEISRTTPEQVKRRLLAIQRDQEQRKRLRGLSRVQLFIEKAGKFDDFCTQAKVWGDDSSFLSAWIWGPVLFIFRVSADDDKALENILSAYRVLGRCIPAIDRYQELVNKRPQVVRCLAFMYLDLLKFHQRVVKLLSDKGWKKTFDTRWRDYQSELKAITFNFETQADVLEILSEAWNEQQNGVAANRVDGIIEQSTAYDQGGAGRDLDDMPVFKHIDQRLNEFITQMQNLMKDKRQESSGGSDACSNHTQVCNDIRKQLNDHVIRSGDNRHALDQMINMFRRLRESLSDQFDRWKAERKDSQRRRVLKWVLHPGVPQTGHHETIRSTQAPRTGSWICDSKTISSWMHEVPAACLVWLNGKMGAGKTVLASHIIEMCTQEVPGFATNYYYCREDDRQQCSALAVLKNILWQMARHNDDLLPVCDNKRAEGGQESLDDIKVVKQLLENFCEYDLHQFVIIDGLDECKAADRETIVGFWESMVEKTAVYKPGKLRVLLVSQDMADIRNLLRLSIIAEVMELNPADTTKDIERYLEKFAPMIKAKFDLSDSQKHDLLRLVCKRAEGMFLYASLTVDNLLEQPTRAFYEGELTKALPKSLADAYVKTIDRLKYTLGENRWIVTRNILSWLAGAMRPLKWHELQMALTIQLDDQGTTRIDYDGHLLRNDIRHMCGPLVHVVEGEEGEVHLKFAHSTTRGHIRSKLKNEGLDGNAIDFDLACKCLSYLSMECFKQNLGKESRRDYARKGYYALQDYAVTEWGHHMQQLIAQTLPLFEGRSHEAKESTRKLNAVFHLFLNSYPEITKDQRTLGTPDKEGDMLQITSSSSALSRHSSFGLSGVSSQQSLTPKDDSSSTGYFPQALSPINAPFSLSPSPAGTKSPDPSGDPIEFCNGFRDIPSLYLPTVQLWTHVYNHQRHVNSKEREKPSLPQLRAVLELTRETIQSLALGEGTIQERLRIYSLYGRTLYKCDRVLCECFFEGFSNADDLEEHLNRHDRPHHCSTSNCAIAPFGFAHKKDLTRHVRTYHPDAEDGQETLAAGSNGAVDSEDVEERYRFRCTFGGCERKFTRQVSLNAHLDTHNGTRRFACSTCVKTFTRDNDRRRHEKQVHLKKR